MPMIGNAIMRRVIVMMVAALQRAAVFGDLREWNRRESLPSRKAQSCEIVGY